MQNSLPVLSLDFSGIQTYRSVEEIENSFNAEIKGSISSFFVDYEELYNFPEEMKAKVLSFRLATDLMNSFIRCMKDLRIRYYLFMDEYDNFANNILIL